MIHWLIDAALRNRFLVIAGFLLIGGWGYWALITTPIDAIPDLSDNQVIVFTDWPGRSPQEVEDQVTYPLTVSLQGLPGVRVVRSSSAFGFSMINVIFEDSVDLYFARARVLERLNLISKSLPAGVVPTLGPDATGVGHVFWYTVEGAGHSLQELRSIQDWFVRYQLNAVPGVAEVASVGGGVRQVATVRVGDAFRAAALVKGTEEAVGGVVVARFGVSTSDVIERVKAKIAALHAGLPAGVRIVPFYDRSALIDRAVATLKRALIEETIVVTIVNVVFLLHLRSVLIVTIPLPLAVLTAFLFMRYLGISS